ncbi:hypothetical protein GH816_08930 [Betaproteobacteria bacterium LSUCC0115]|nr:hypothetical protein [Burkholderiales bacterium LSUCC0115]
MFEPPNKTLGALALAVTLYGSQVLAFGQANFQCGGGEFTKTWYGKDTLVRELSFPLSTTTVDGKVYTIRFLGRSLNATFSGVNISSVKDKFTLYHDRASMIHQLSYEMENGNSVRANCTILTYK